MEETPPFLSDFDDYLQRIGRSNHTCRAYRTDLTDFFRWLALSTGDNHPNAVDSRDIRDYRDFLRQRGKAVSTINRRLKALTTFFRWAVRTGLTAYSPFDDLERATIREGSKPMPAHLESREQQALLRRARASGNLRDVALLHVLLGTGLRIAEVAALNVSDVTLSARKGWLTVRGGKGNKARDIPLANKTRQALADYLAVREFDGGERLFLGQRGPLNPAGIHYLVKKYAYQARLPHCTAHTLRHTFAKNLVDAGVPLDQVAMLLGHESLDTTKIYTRPGRRDLERAVRMVDGEPIAER